ncbi:uncharacterized protein K441DRAFT_668356 [Cenococcum geophilum 1.58]|uniref:uncharacterized protein n=1 Tax=Cenococcum geophilum 1.58 TaxID=794803 RepID=UPI00358E0101|nr:hypothetical protein K441DRAFT_668356 [Cenococcum geophilum 1.58]
MYMHQVACTTPIKTLLFARVSTSLSRLVAVASPSRRSRVAVVIQVARTTPIKTLF